MNKTSCFKYFALLVLLFGLLAPNSLKADEADTPDLFSESISDEFERVNIAVVLADIYSNKDLEFAKGFIYGMEDQMIPSYSKINLKLLNGEIPEDSLYQELVDFQPALIISTHDKNCPEAINMYIPEGETTLINAFDAKGEGYKGSPKIFQFLTPSAEYNRLVGKYISDAFRGRNLVIVGEPDSADAILERLVGSFPAETDNVRFSELPNYAMQPGQEYLFYVTSTKKDEIKKILSALKALKYTYRDSDMEVVGRSNWIAMNDLNADLAELGAYIPAKLYFNPNQGSTLAFIEGYNAKYGHNPIKSYPVYSVAGYDIATYFLPAFLDKDIRVEDYWWPVVSTLQSEINLHRDSMSEGYYNSSCFLVRFSDDGGIEKILIK